MSELPTPEKFITRHATNSPEILSGLTNEAVVSANVKKIGAIAAATAIENEFNGAYSNLYVADTSGAMHPGDHRAYTLDGTGTPREVSHTEVRAKANERDHLKEQGKGATTPGIVDLFRMSSDDLATVTGKTQSEIFRAGKAAIVNEHLGFNRERDPSTESKPRTRDSLVSEWADAEARNDTEASKAAEAAYLGHLTEANKQGKISNEAVQTATANLSGYHSAKNSHNTHNKDKLLYEAHDLLTGLPETIEAGKKNRELSEAEALSALSYNDITDRTGRDPAEALEQTKESPNGLNYAHQLQALVKRVGRAELNRHLAEMRATARAGLSELGNRPSPYVDSKSWALWDIAKQSYLYNHPEESSLAYKHNNRGVDLADPLAENEAGEAKRREIIHRHIGWEVDQAASRSGRPINEWLSNLWVYPSKQADLKRIVADTPGYRNESGELRSYVLAHLGQKSLEYTGVSLDPDSGLLHLKAA